MMAVILSGGRGTRLHPFSITVPKPLLPLGDIPILEIVLRQLAMVGVSKVVLTLNHMAPLFSAFFGNGKKLGLELAYCIEEKPMGTAGALRLIQGLDDNFIVMNGDLLTTISYAALYDIHVRNHAVGTIAVRTTTVDIEYGVVEAAPDGLLAAYREKPRLSYLISMGINVLSRDCLSHIPPDVPFDMPDLMMALRKEGKRVQCYEADCYWKDIGRFEDYQQATEDFGKNPSLFWPG